MLISFYPVQNSEMLTKENYKRLFFVCFSKRYNKERMFSLIILNEVCFLGLIPVSRPEDFSLYGVKSKIGKTLLVK